MYHIPLIKPYIPDRAKTAVLEVLESGYLTEGPVTRAFEERCRAYIGCTHALAVSNCTVGLEMALRCLSIGPGDEVIVPDYTYPATAAVVRHVGATVVLVDVEPRTMLIDYDSLEEAITPRTKAIMPVSLFGNPLDHDRLRTLADRHGLLIIEDAACAMGSEYKARQTGNWADISVFSLHPRKFITTGEGGLITTNRDEWASWMHTYKHFGMTADGTREGASFQIPGSNHKLSNLLAAIGLAQMDEVEGLLQRRRELADTYTELLVDAPGIRQAVTTAGGLHAYQTYCVFVEQRDQVMTRMREAGIEVQIGTYALSREPAYQPSDFCRWHGDLAASRTRFHTCLALPLYHELTQAQQKEVVDALNQTLRDVTSPDSG